MTQVFQKFSSALALCRIVLPLSPPPRKTPQDDKQSSSSSPRWYNPTRYNPANSFRRGPTAVEQLVRMTSSSTGSPAAAGSRRFGATTQNLQAICSRFQNRSPVASPRFAPPQTPKSICLPQMGVTGTKPAKVSDSARALPTAKPCLCKSIAFLRARRPTQGRSDHDRTPQETTIKDQIPSSVGNSYAKFFRHNDRESRHRVCLSVRIGFPNIRTRLKSICVYLQPHLARLRS